MKIAVLTDSGVGISLEQLKKDGIFMLPLQIIIDDMTYRDVYEINDQQLYAAQRNGKLPHTSCSNGKDMSDILKYFVDNGYTDIIFVPLSSGLSSQSNFLLTLAKEYPLTIHFIDCYSTCMVQYHVAKNVKHMVDNGESIETIIEKANQLVDSAISIVAPLNLEQLKRGGRLTPVAASMANLLKIKPIINIDKSTAGKLDSYAKVRTEKKAIQFVVDGIIKFTNNQPYHIYVIHSDCRDRANEIIDELKQYPNLTVDIGVISSVISAHTGVDCLCIQAIKDIA